MTDTGKRVPAPRSTARTLNAARLSAFLNGVAQVENSGWLTRLTRQFNRPMAELPQLGIARGYPRNHWTSHRRAG